MRNVKSKQSKATQSGGKGWTIFVIGAVAVMVLSAGFTAKNVLDDRAAANVAGDEGQVSVAVASTDIITGGEFNGCYEYVYRDAEELPVDAIQSGYDFSGAVAAINITPNTILTQGMMVRPDLDESTDDTTRKIAVNYVSLDSGVTEGDFIDIRLKKSGTVDGLTYQDDVVLAKKKVQSVSGREITLQLSEAEQLKMSVAAVDASSYGRSTESGITATLYATRYVDASQAKAEESYSNAKLEELIENNPNIIAEAQRELAVQQSAEDTEIVDSSGVDAQ